METKKLSNASIVLNIKGDDKAKEIYSKIKELLYDSDIKYFDHEINLHHTHSSGFRNTLKKE
jgi:ketol-acid reductoisomerase